MKEHIHHIIVTQSLTRDFKETRAVKALDLKIKQGELFGLVGPDGAGKTTILRLLAGLLQITEGQASVAGFDLGSQAEAIKPHIGYMSQQFSLYAELTVIENLQFFSDLYDIPPKQSHDRTDRLLDFAGLTDFQKRRAGHLSGGMQKKLALACTLLHQPKILLLDEPTTGVDPISRREFWNILTELHITGTTIIVSTPYMDEADRCSQVGLMYEGEMMIIDAPGKIRSRINGELIQVYPDDWQAAHDLILKIPGISEIQTYGEALHILVDSGKKQLPIIEQSLQKSGINYTNARIAPARMEEAFISLIRKLDQERTVKEE
jgi:ABC-2 type transport system ATP-binding protein